MLEVGAQCVCVCVCVLWRRRKGPATLVWNPLEAWWEWIVVFLATKSWASSLQYLTIYIHHPQVCLSHIELVPYWACCIVRLFVNFHVCGYRFDATCWVLRAWRNYIVKMETFFLLYLVCLVSMKFWPNGDPLLIHIVMCLLYSMYGNIFFIKHIHQCLEYVIKYVD
jgi:hypothetical protein